MVNPLLNGIGSCTRLQNELFLDTRLRGYDGYFVIPAELVLARAEGGNPGEVQLMPAPVRCKPGNVRSISLST
jgi:hypothetical protein